MTDQAEVGRKPELINSDALAASFHYDGVHSQPSSSELNDVASIMKLLKVSDDAQKNKGEADKFSPFIRQSLEYYTMAAELLGKDPPDDKSGDALRALRRHPSIGSGIHGVMQLAKLLEARADKKTLDKIFEESEIDRKLASRKSSIFRP